MSGHFQDFALRTLGQYVQTVGSAQISVFLADGVTPASIYTDQGLTNLITQPLIADSSGNYGFWALAGNYVVKTKDPATQNVFSEIVAVSDFTGNTIASVNLSGQNAAIVSTPFYAVPSGGAGMYEIALVAGCDHAGTGGTFTVQFQWLDQFTNYSQVLLNLVPLTFAQQFTAQPVSFYSAASQNISYSVGIVGFTGAPTYFIKLRLRYLG